MEGFTCVLGWTVEYQNWKLWVEWVGVSYGLWDFTTWQMIIVFGRFIEFSESALNGFHNIFNLKTRYGVIAGTNTHLLYFQSTL